MPRTKKWGPKLESEHASGRFTVDVTLGGGAENSPGWCNMGMIEKFTNFIPGIEKVDKMMYSLYGHFFIPSNTVLITQYNTKVVSTAEAPKKWEDLHDPKWKGKIRLTADMDPWIILSLAEGGRGIEKTEDYLRKLRQQQPIWASGHTAGHQLVKEFGEIFGTG